MKKKVLSEVTVEIDPPSYVTRWADTVEKEAQRLEEWVSEFNDFLRDHRSQDKNMLSVNRKFIDVCSFCGYEWDVDGETGEPMCCQKAQDERRFTAANKRYGGYAG
jgi:hypothetical protein